MDVTASADGGARVATQSFSFGDVATEDYLLARPDRALVRVGETVRVDLLCSVEGARVSLQFLAAGRSLETREVTLGGATAQVEFVPTQDALGEVVVVARTLGPTGRLLQDRRTLVVDQGAALDVVVSADRPARPAR